MQISNKILYIFYFRNFDAHNEKENHFSVNVPTLIEHSLKGNSESEQNRFKVGLSGKSQINVPSANAPILTEKSFTDKHSAHAESTYQK